MIKNICGSDFQPRPDQTPSVRSRRSPLCSLHIISSSAENRGHFSVLPYCRGANLTTITYGGSVPWLLAGRISANTQFSGDDLQPQRSKIPVAALSRIYCRRQNLDRFAQANHGKRVIHLALRWLLDRPGGGRCAVGRTTPRDQLRPFADVHGVADQCRRHGLD